MPQETETTTCPFLDAWLSPRMEPAAPPAGFSPNAWRYDGDGRLAKQADAMLWQNVLIQGRPNDPRQIENARMRAVDAFSAIPGFVDC